MPFCIPRVMIGVYMVEPVQFYDLSSMGPRKSHCKYIVFWFGLISEKEKDGGLSSSA